MGSEMHDLCVECTAKYQQRTETSGECDWCHKEATLKATRDYDEGSTGPVYWVCAECRSKRAEEDMREARADLDFDDRLMDEIIDELEEEEDFDESECYDEGDRHDLS